MAIIFSVTVENTVDTGVGTHVDILAPGHPSFSASLGNQYITRERGNWEIRSWKEEETEKPKRNYHFEDCVLKGV